MVCEILGDISQVRYFISQLTDTWKFMTESKSEEIKVHYILTQKKLVDLHFKRFINVNHPEMCMLKHKDALIERFLLSEGEENVDESRKAYFKTIVPKAFGIMKRRVASALCVLLSTNTRERKILMKWQCNYGELAKLI